MYKITVFGKVLIQMENPNTAARYAQAIRMGMWQCNETEEPWHDGQFIRNDKFPNGHTCGPDCCDSRTDDEVKLEAV